MKNNIKEVTNSIRKEIVHDFELTITDVKMNDYVDFCYTGVVKSFGEEYNVDIDTDIFNFEYSQARGFEILMDEEYEDSDSYDQVLEFLFNGDRDEYEQFLFDSLYKFHVENNLPLVAYSSGKVMLKCIKHIDDILYTHNGTSVRCIKNTDSIKIVVDGTDLECELEGYLDDETNEYYIGEYLEETDEFDTEVNLYLLGK